VSAPIFDVLLLQRAARTRAVCVAEADVATQRLHLPWQLGAVRLEVAPLVATRGYRPSRRNDVESDRATGERTGEVLALLEHLARQRSSVSGCRMLADHEAVEAIDHRIY